MYACEDISARLAEHIDRALKRVDPDVLALLEKAEREEENERARWALGQIAENDRIAADTDCYPCQDTGQAMLFVTVG